MGNVGKQWYIYMTQTTLFAWQAYPIQIIKQAQNSTKQTE